MFRLPGAIAETVQRYEALHDVSEYILEGEIMKSVITAAMCLFAGTFFVALESDAESRPSGTGSGSGTTAFDQAVAAQPKLLHLSARCDGSGRIIFTQDAVHYEHRHWGPLREVLFDGEPWTNLRRTPVVWSDFGKRLDLTRAWIVDRKGRDVIALERTADGFDLYLSDSPNGGAEYSVTIAIPRRP